MSCDLDKVGSGTGVGGRWLGVGKTKKMNEGEPYIMLHTVNPLISAGGAYKFFHF